MSPARCWARNCRHTSIGPSDFLRQAGASAARSALAQAASSGAAGPRLQEQVARVTELVRQAETPVRVELASDNVTDVQVYRVGKLGLFERRELELMPGRYTVVGTRQGYRDVRKEINLLPGAAPPPSRFAARSPFEWDRTDPARSTGRTAAGRNRLSDQYWRARVTRSFSATLRPSARRCLARLARRPAVPAARRRRSAGLVQWRCGHQALHVVTRGRCHRHRAWAPAALARARWRAHAGHRGRQRRQPDAAAGSPGRCARQLAATTRPTNASRPSLFAGPARKPASTAARCAADWAACSPWPCLRLHRVVSGHRTLVRDRDDTCGRCRARARAGAGHAHRRQSFRAAWQYELVVAEEGLSHVAQAPGVVSEASSQKFRYALQKLPGRLARASDVPARVECCGPRTRPSPRRIQARSRPARSDGHGRALPAIHGSRE